MVVSIALYTNLAKLKMIFSANLTNNRLEIPADFRNSYEKGNNNLESNDFLILKMNNRIVPGFVNIGNDRGRIRKRVRIPKMFFSPGKTDVKILSHIKTKESRHDKNRFFAGKKVDLYYAIPNRDIKGSEIGVGMHKKELFLFRPSILKAVKIKRYIETRCLLEIMGLYQGEGLRNAKRIQKVQFSNNLPELINKFLDFFETLGLGGEEWKINVGLTGNVDGKRKEKSKRYWLSKTKIPEKNFRGFCYTKTFGNLHNPMGTCIVIYDSSVLAHVFLSLMRRIEDFIKDEDGAWIFINGLMEADGSVETKNGFLSEVNIAYDTAQEAKFYRNFIEKYLNIETGVRPNKRIVLFKKYIDTGDKWDVWYKLVKFNVFRNHCFRREKLIRGFLKHKKTRIIYKCLKGLVDDFATTRDIMRTANYNQKTGVIYIMKQLEKQGLVSIVRKKKRLIYRITENGKEFLDIYLKNQYAFAK